MLKVWLPTDEGLQCGKGVFDRVEVLRIRWKKLQTTSYVVGHELDDKGVVLRTSRTMFLKQLDDVIALAYSAID